MKIGKIMTRDVAFADPGDLLSEAVEKMQERDCGILPVVSDERVVSMISDRDIAMAPALRDRLLSEIRIGEVVAKEPVTCYRRESIGSLLRKMREFRVRRLPVVDKDGRLEGIVSIADVLRSCGKRKALRKKVVKTLTALSERTPIVLREVP